MVLEIWRLYNDGYEVWEIAKKLKISKLHVISVLGL